MKRFLSHALAAASILAAGAVHADGPEMRARSADECRLFADMAIVARALVQTSVDTARQRPVMETIYQPDDARTNALLDRILGAARRATDPAPVWASTFIQECMQRRGDMEAMLGGTS